MGKIIILDETSSHPVQLIGKMSGICYGSDITNETKNYKRGLDCLENNHGRTLESVDIYMILNGYSAKLAREFYTHIGGSPMRLQASTRYIDYAKKGLPYVIPPKIAVNEKAKQLYIDTIEAIENAAFSLEEDFGIAKEDASMLFPLAMESKFVVKCNLRMLIDMSHQRMCNRAFWEYRQLMRDLCDALAARDEEWKYIIDNYMKPKCDILGYCPETFGCGRKPKKEEKI